MVTTNREVGCHDHLSRAINSDCLIRGCVKYAKYARLRDGHRWQRSRGLWKGHGHCGSDREAALAISGKTAAVNTIASIMYTISTVGDVDITITGIHTKV